MAQCKKNSTWLFVYLLVLYVVILYSNTFQVPFMLDDRTNIVDRPNLHLLEITIDNVIDTFFVQEGDSRRLNRPLSCLSLALNYYFGRFNVTGYHFVNLTIHAVAAVFLFKTLILVLGLKKFNFRTSEINCIAGLAAILWAGHPIQTQAVTYIVQRMASLSSMFYLIGIWFYLKFRYSDTFSKGKYFLIFSFLSFICAIFSKENAVLFPLGLFLIELFFFDGYKKIQVNPLKSFCFACIVIIVPLLFFYHTSSLEKILSAYDYRPFTLKQRLLTEPRILFFYISQLLYPVPEKFSISHSFILSNSLFTPFSTFFSIAGIICVLGLAMTMGRKYPIIGFPVVFFLTHHLVESTIIPLELVYEHRNYLPSLFFYLPFSYGVFKLLSFYRKQMMFYIIFIFCCSIIFLFGFSTYLRNNAWQSHEALWNNAVMTSPDLIRPYSQLAWSYTSRNRTNVKKALFYFQQGLDKNTSYNIFEKTFLWLNIARTYEHAGNFEEAKNASLKCLNAFEKELEKKSSLLNKNLTKIHLSNIHHYLAEIYLYLNDMNTALFHINIAINLKPKSVFYNSKAKYLIHLHKYQMANKVLQRSLKQDHDNWETYFFIGNTLTSMKNFSQGFWFYNLALKKADDMNQSSYNAMIYLYMAENNYQSGNIGSGNRYLDQFLQLNSIATVKGFIQNYNTQHRKMLPFTDPKALFKRLYTIIFTMPKTDE